MHGVWEFFFGSVAYQPLSRLICLYLSVRAARSIYCDCRRLVDATSKIGSLPVVM